LTPLVTAAEENTGPVPEKQILPELVTFHQLNPNYLSDVRSTLHKRKDAHVGKW
jgi:hypothetical protein